MAPTVFFAALDRGSITPGNGSTSGLPTSFVPLVGDSVRRDILRMSRAISILLLVMYVQISQILLTCIFFPVCLTSFRRYIVSCVWRHGMGASEGQAECDCHCHRRDCPCKCSCPCNCHNDSHPWEENKCNCESEKTVPESASLTGAQPDSSSDLQILSSSDTETGHKAPGYRPWVHVVIIFLAVGLMAVTSEFVSMFMRALCVNFSLISISRACTACFCR